MQKINPEISSKGFSRMFEGVISNVVTDNIHLLVSSFNYELVKLKRKYRITKKINKNEVQPISIDEFIKKIDSKVYIKLQS